MILALEIYNNTNVSCVAASLDSQYPDERTPNVSLVVQGPLGSVSNLKLNVGLNSSSTLTWDPPFSLNLTSVHPDVIYCVDIYNITCGVAEHLMSDCNVAEPYYSFYSEDDIHKFTVTPRSNVPNSRNGAASFQSEEYRMFSASNLESVAYKTSRLDSIQFSLKVHFNQTTMESHLKLLQQYSIQLKARDGVEPSAAEYTALTATTGGETALEFNVNFQYGRLWEGLLLGTSCGGIPLSNSFDLSTHEVHSISVDQNILTDQLNLTWNFINGSNSPGILIVAYPLVYDSDISYNIILRPTDTKTQTTLLSGVSGIQYNISVFALLENGQPFTRSVAKPYTVTILGYHELVNNPPVITIHTTSEDNGVCVTCTIIDNSLSGTCLLVIHPKPSGLHFKGGLSNIDVLLLNRSGNHSASGCIYGISHASHMIAAFLYDETQHIQGPAFVVNPQPHDTGTLSTRSGQLWIILTSVLIGLFVITVLLLVIIVFIRLVATSNKGISTSATQHDRESHIELKKCDAYEVPRLARQKILTERNPAYETVGARNGQ